MLSINDNRFIILFSYYLLYFATTFFALFTTKINIIPQAKARIEISATTLSPTNGLSKSTLVALKIINNTLAIKKMYEKIFMRFTD